MHEESHLMLTSQAAVGKLILVTHRQKTRDTVLLGTQHIWKQRMPGSENHPLKEVGRISFAMNRCLLQLAGKLIF